MLICDGCGTEFAEGNAVRAQTLCDQCAEKAKGIGDEVCDFCSTPHPTWGYPCRTFSTGTLSQVQPTTGKVVPFDHVSVEDWAACDTCHELIDANEREALLARCLLLVPGGDVSDDPLARFAIKGLHAQFFANRQGPPYRHATSEEAGCWVDGHWGQYGITQVIAIARERGWQIDQEGIDIAAAWTRGYPEGDLDAVVALADEAEAWLNDKVAPWGFHFGWHDGEFFFEPASWWKENA